MTSKWKTRKRKGAARAVSVAAPKTLKARSPRQVPLSQASRRRLAIAAEVIECLSSLPRRGGTVTLQDGAVLVTDSDGKARRVGAEEVGKCLESLVSSGKIASAVRIPDGFSVSLAKPHARNKPRESLLRPLLDFSLPPIEAVMHETLAAACSGLARHAEVRTRVARALGFDPARSTKGRFGDSLDARVGACLHAHQKLGHVRLDGKNIATLQAGRERMESGRPYSAEELPRRYVPLPGRRANAPRGPLPPDALERLLASIPSMKPEKLVHLWRNAGRILSDSAKPARHEAARRVIEAVETAWDSLVIEEGELFPWPTTDVDEASGASAVPGLRSEGMLSYLEYRVGKAAGMSSAERQAILSRILEGRLPRVFDPAYMEEWGEPRSGRRLRKMAESLAAFARKFKRLDEDKYDEAIRQWEQDLDFLYHAYYLGRFGFGWPTTDVGTPSLRARR